MSDWISVKNRLPTHEGDVIALGSCGGVMDCSYMDRRWWYPVYCTKELEITHWMPLILPTDNASEAQQELDL